MVANLLIRPKPQRALPALRSRGARRTKAWSTATISTLLLLWASVPGLSAPPSEESDGIDDQPRRVNHGLAADAAGSALPVAAVDGTPSLIEEVIGVVQPFRTASLAPVRQGRIASIAAPEGTRVMAGDPIFTLAAEAQQVRVQIAKAKAESTLAVELARARWEQARQERDRLTDLHGEANATLKEYTDSVAAEVTTHLEFEQARFKHAQDLLSYELEQAKLDELHARAPFDGYVSRQIKEVGETVDEREFVVTLVQLNPLLVAVYCPLALAPRIHSNDRLTVRPMDDHWSPREGRVVLINAVADGASQMFKVKLSIDNEDGGWIAGMKVVVEFPERPSDDEPMARAIETDVRVGEAYVNAPVGHDVDSADYRATAGEQGPAEQSQTGS